MELAPLGLPTSLERTARSARATFIVVALFLLLTVTLAWKLNIWQDEAYSLHTTSGGIANALHQGVFYEAQAPLYFGILDVWRSLDRSPFFARLLSIVFSLATIAFAWRFSRRYIDAVPSGLVTAAVAFNPFTIWAAIEARPYALSIALATALIFYFFRGWIDDDERSAPRIAFVTIAIVAAYTQYYVVTLVPAAFVALLALRRGRALRSYAVAAVVVALAIAPLALIVPLQLKAYSVLPVAPSRFASIAILLAVLQFLFPHDWVGSWAHRPLLNALYFLAVVPIAVLALRRARGYGVAARALATLVAVLCIVFAIVIGPGHVAVIWPRQAAVLFPTTMFAAFALVGGIARARRSLVLGPFLFVYATFAALALWSQYHGFSKDGDWRRVGSFLTAHVAPGDAVAVFDAEAALPLQYYFHALPVTPVPRPISFDRFDESDFIIHDEGDVASSLGAAAHGHVRLWLVLNEVCTTSPAFYGCVHLRSYVARNFTTVGVTAFDRSTVMQLRPLRRGDR